MRFWLPIRSGGLPICRRRFPYPVAFPICFRGSPCDSTAFHTQAIFPYGIAVFPYGHTPDASPHTPHQIPIGRPSPHTIRKLQKSDFKFGETSVPVQQIPNQPRQADIQNLRYNPANQKPTGSSKSHGYSLHKPGAGQFQQMLQTCDWGVAPALPARVCARIYGHGHAHISMVTHAHAFKGMSKSGRISDETSGSGSLRSSANPIHSNALKLRNTSADQALTN